MLLSVFLSSAASPCSALIRLAVLNARSAASNRFDNVRRSPCRRYASASRVDEPARREVRDQVCR